MKQLQNQLEAFRREVGVRKGTDQQAMLALFAYANDPPENRQNLTAYLDAVIGPPVRRATSNESWVLQNGNVKFRLVSSTQDPNGSRRIVVCITPPTRWDLDLLLAGQHPVLKNDPEDLMTGRELAHLTVYFDDGISMVVAITRVLEQQVGVEYYLVKDGDMLNTSGFPASRDTILGEYSLWAVDQASDGPNPPTHILEITEQEA